MPCIGKKLRKVMRHDLGNGDYANIMELSAADVLRLQKWYGDSQSTDNVRFAADVLAAALVDDDGHPIFTNGQDVLDNLPGGNPKLFGELADAAVSHSGLGAEVKN